MSAKYQNKDHDLVSGLRKNKRQAFRKIFDNYQSKLLFYCTAIVKEDSVAKDIVQETFIRLWINRQKLDPDQSLSGYLHTIARNLSLNHLKRAGYDQELKQQIWRAIEEDQDRILTEEIIFANECQSFVDEAVDKLPPKRKLIFQLSREKGMSHQDIATRLNISKNTVKNQMVSALKEIRAYLKRYSNVALSLLAVAKIFW